VGKINVKNLVSNKIETLNADFVIMMVGYLPDVNFLQKIGLNVSSEALKPEFNENTFETKIDNLFLCGTVMAGTKTETIFIENGRDHAKQIAEIIKERNSKN
jgi:thioredoxin reductase (NADPH)